MFSVGLIKVAERYVMCNQHRSNDTCKGRNWMANTCAEL